MPEVNPDPIFVRPPSTPRHPLGSLDGVSSTCMQGEKPVHGDVIDTMGYLCRYNVNSDKENDKDATQVSQACQDAEGVGHGRGQGRRSDRSVGEAEEGPIHLYHPWQAHSVGVQVTPCPKCYVSTGRQPDLGGALSDCHLLSCAGVSPRVFSQY